MIKAFIFDLDGTLVQTESLKAISYARAAVEVCLDELKESEVIEAFKDVVGLSRKEVAQYLINTFGLEKTLRGKISEFGVQTVWQALVQIRLKIYENMLTDQGILHDYKCPYNIGLLEWAKENDYKIGLATMSHCKQANRVLEILQLKKYMDFIATRDDVENGKPDPEIYLLVTKEFELNPNECLVIEDSPSGVRAALDAGMGCIAVTNDFTRKSIHESKLLEDRWIVDDRQKLLDIAQQFISEFENKIEGENDG